MWTDAALLVGLGFAAGYGIRAWISTSSIFNELYFCIPTDDGGNPFGLKFIRSNIAPMSRKPTAAFGGDLAKSVDWTVLHGLDEDGCTSEHHRFQLPWKATMDRIRLICGYVTSFLDSTGVGDPIVEQLQAGNEEHSNFKGDKFTQQSKQMLMEGLAVAIQQNEIQYPDGVIVSELESFVYEHTPAGPTPLAAYN